MPLVEVHSTLCTVVFHLALFFLLFFFFFLFPLSSPPPRVVNYNSPRYAAGVVCLGRPFVARLIQSERLRADGAAGCVATKSESLPFSTGTETEKRGTGKFLLTSRHTGEKNNYRRTRGVTKGDKRGKRRSRRRRRLDPVIPPGQESSREGRINRDGASDSPCQPLSLFSTYACRDITARKT